MLVYQRVIVQICPAEECHPHFWGMRRISSHIIFCQLPSGYHSYGSHSPLDDKSIQKWWFTELRIGVFSSSQSVKSSEGLGLAPAALRPGWGDGIGALGRRNFLRGLGFTMGFTLQTKIDVDKPWFPWENDQWKPWCRRKTPSSPAW